MVGRLHNARWHDRTQAGISHPRLCFRNVHQAGSQGSREETECGERRQGSAVFHAEPAGICRTVLHSFGLPHPETLDAEALSFNSRPASAACLRPNSALRHRTVEVQRFILQKFDERVGLGNMQSPSQSVVENLRQCKEVGTLLRERIQPWSGTPRKTSRKSKQVLMPDQIVRCWRSCANLSARWS